MESQVSMFFFFNNGHFGLTGKVVTNGKAWKNYHATITHNYLNSKACGGNRFQELNCANSNINP